MLPKNYSVDFNDYLHSDEVKCKCKFKDCTHTLVSPLAIDAFYRMRLAFGAVLRINSFYRCQKHNKSVGGSNSSSHKSGLAVDVSTRGFTVPEIARLKELARENFDYVLEYDTFIHCQQNPDGKE